MTLSCQLRLDGTVEVTLPNGETTVHPLQRLTRLYDTMEQLEDLWGDEMQGDGEEGDHPDEEEVWAMDEDGNWQQGPRDDDDEWEEEVDEPEDDDNAMAVDGDGWKDDSSPPATEANPNGGSWWPNFLSTIQESKSSTQNGEEGASARASTSPDVPQDSTQAKDAVDLVAVNGIAEVPQPSLIPNTDSGDCPWKRFEILSEAPHDHAFYSSTPAQPSRQFHARLQKEYRALTNSLPGRPFHMASSY